MDVILSHRILILHHIVSYQIVRGKFRVVTLFEIVKFPLKDVNEHIFDWIFVFLKAEFLNDMEDGSS